MTSFITIVSGLPRSGTSLMMKMLESGGINPLTDRQRAADADNPNGYYEFERVKQLPQGDHAWLAEAEGKAVKIIAAFLPQLPVGREYRVVFMQRDLREILASQKKMLEHRGAQQQIGDEALIGLFEKHLRQVEKWFQTQSNVARMEVNYNELMRDPAPIVDRLRLFLDLEPDSSNMLGVINPTLYRQRAPAGGIPA